MPRGVARRLAPASADHPDRRPESDLLNATREGIRPDRDDSRMHHVPDTARSGRLGWIVALCRSAPAPARGRCKTRQSGHVPTRRVQISISDMLICTRGTRGGELCCVLHHARGDIRRRRLGPWHPRRVGHARSDTVAAWRLRCQVVHVARGWVVHVAPGMAPAPTSPRSEHEPHRLRAHHRANARPLRCRPAPRPPRPITRQRTAQRRPATPRYHHCRSEQR